MLSFGVASKSPFRGDQEGRGIAPADGTALSKALGQLLPVQSLLPFLGGDGEAGGGWEVVELWQKRGEAKVGPSGREMAWGESS